MLFTTKKLLLLLTVYNNCVFIAEGSDDIWFHQADGKVLEDDDKIKIVYGTFLELFCTGQSSDRMSVRRFGPGEHLIPAITINQTTVKIIQENLERGAYVYTCTHSLPLQSSQDTYVRVIVDSVPIEINLSCITENVNYNIYYDVYYMNCSLTSVNYIMNVSLYYVKNGVPFRLCKLHYLQLTVDRSPRCIWDQTHPVIEYISYEATLTFLTSTCNIWGCANKTFVFDHRSVLRIAPVTDLELLEHSSHSASLRWKAPLLVEHLDYVYIFVYRIIYVYSGIHQFKVNTTSIEDYDVEIDLKLPCADTLYEVRVSAKLSAAEGEEYWSDDALIEFATDPDPEGTVETDTTCERRRVKLTPEVMLSELDKFKSDVIKEQKALKEKISSLKLKGGEH